MVLHYSEERFTNVRGKYAIGFSRFALTLPRDISPRVLHSEEYTLWTNPGKAKVLWLENPDAK
jgi:hypothetical protein